ncbi:transient receptor potential cation channel subfamily A member 1-like [Dendronephthya gigantea]|uniref:transient receptor potential cation channel subfamily A member 1-like n=1 Tax=Dendronephthya gigantea TaxID=151771 RepID=UPI0010697F4D|nr:transient receptor potential cation channel subfamily A member 1-like [Dendronephthya gigantea]
MATAPRKRKYISFPKRQKSIDYGLHGGPDDPNGTHITLHRLKSIDEKDSTDQDMRIDYGTNTLSNSCVTPNKNDQLKLAAIYDDEPQIIRILSSLTNQEDVQRILATNDERGQPCIFYALESRSKNALACLLHHIKFTECVIAENGESVLHVATKMGDIDIVRRLLEEELVAHLVDHVEGENGRAPLHLAAWFNHIEIAQTLVKHGAKIDRPDITGKSPIYMAACSGHADMLRDFLEHEKDRVEDLLFSKSYGGGLYKNIFHVAVGSGDASSVQVCLEQDQEIVRRYLQEEVKHGNAHIIHAACKNGMEKCLMRIVESMGRLDTIQLNMKDNLGFAPIHKAAINDHANLVRFIGLKSRIFLNEKTENSQTSLVLAAQRGHINVVEQLLELKADFTITDDSDRTVLHYSIEYPDILKLLLRKKALTQLLINAKEKDGYTPIHNAALRGLCESVRILLDHGADLNVFTNTSRSPLHCAVSSQCLDMVELIRAKEPALINKADATGKTPLHTAASYGSAEVVRCLLNNGALIVRDGNMFTALHIASCKGHLTIVEMLATFNKSIIDWPNKYGRTALLCAAKSCKTDVVKYLLDSNAAITEDYELYNCLDWSMIKNDKQSAMVMMSHDRWKEVMSTTKHGTEGTMTKLVGSMPEVAYRVLSNSMKSVGHPESKEHLVRYTFMSLQNLESTANKTAKSEVRPLAAIKAMIRNNCYNCLCHPVCCKYLKAKWMQFGWKIYSASLLIYIVFLISLNVYAFGIPTYKESLEKKENQNASINVKVAMVICIIFASFNAFKEIVQLLVYKFNYFMDKVNYLECILYISTFIFAVPNNGMIAIKSSSQWKSCSVALFCAWLNLVMYLRRFASYGIIILMMRKISATLLKVMLLLIFFLVAFAAGFTVIMNDRDGYQRFGLSMITSAVMSLGEFELKETFLKDAFPDYKTFYWLRLAHLIAFLVVMPIIIMNLLLALAIDDTSSIMQRAKLQKHIQTAKMIIDLERKRLSFMWKRPTPVADLEERPNKKHDFSRTIWEFVFYGPDFSTEQSNDTPRGGTNAENLEMIVDMMKDLQRQTAILQNKVMEIQNEFTVAKNRRSLEIIRLSQDRQHVSTQFRGFSESIEGSVPWEQSAETKRKVWVGVHREKDTHSMSTQSPSVLDPSDIIMSAEQDVFDDEERERKEHDPELKELKELHNQLEVDENDIGAGLWGNDDEEEGGKTEKGGANDETSERTLEDDGGQTRLLQDGNGIIV